MYWKGKVCEGLAIEVKEEGAFTIMPMTYDVLNLRHKCTF